MIYIYIYICNRTTIARAPCRTNPESREDKIDTTSHNLGMFFEADQRVLNEENESGLHRRYAVVVQDLATQWVQSYPCRNTQWIQGYPCRNKTAQDTMNSNFT